MKNNRTKEERVNSVPVNCEKFKQSDPNAECDCMTCVEGEKAMSEVRSTQPKDTEPPSKGNEEEIQETKGWEDEIHDFANSISGGDLEFIEGELKSFIQEVRHKAVEEERERLRRGIQELKQKTGWLPLGVSKDPWNKALEKCLNLLNKHE